MNEAARSLRAVKHGDPDADMTVHEEVGFLMLAKIFQCFAIDHQPSKR